MASRDEWELFGVIRLLRELVDALRGDARAFRADINQSSDRVADLAGIDDVRTLRKALSREVDQLGRSVQAQEVREKDRIEQSSGKIRHIESRLVEGDPDEDRATRLPRRAALERRLDSVAASESCTLMLLRIDEVDDIVREHGRGGVDRVILCIAQLLQVTLGAQTGAHRVDALSVAAGGQQAAVCGPRSAVCGLRSASTLGAPA